MNHANSIKVWVSSLLISETDLWPGGNIMSWWRIPRLQLSQKRAEEGESGLNSQSWGPLAGTWLHTTLPLSLSLALSLCHINYDEKQTSLGSPQELRMASLPARPHYSFTKSLQANLLRWRWRLSHPSSGLATNNVRCPAEQSNNTLNCPKWFLVQKQQNLNKMKEKPPPNHID